MITTTEKEHVLDPEGDTMLVLSNPNAPFAVFDSSKVPASAVAIPDARMKASEVVPSISATSQDEPWSPCPSRSEPNQRLGEVRFRLSSKHLTSASSYFRAQLSGPWKDNVKKDGQFIINAQDWNAMALLIVMRILHGRGNKVHKDVSLELMAQIAVIIDYYACHDACSFFYDTWINRSLFENTVVGASGRDHILALFASYVFSSASMFRVASDRVVKASRAPMHSLGLPIPESVIEAIATKRHELLDATATVLRDLLRYFSYDGSDTSLGCRDFNCAAMQTGALLNNLRQFGLDIDKLEQAVDGYSILEVHKALEFLRQPPLFVRNGNMHRCARDGALSRSLSSAITNVNKCQNLTLSDFQKVVAHRGGYVPG
ncbi:hypothetical protein OCS_06589 [Ophiocordyceps sinensis CO18]|uniref:BTB domain-containing protein n=1 Tax=Ophiocordyceps sinensis (strain Co18 / CGMCC 3.14243) TaxID=911162 RepID=T4ZX49_OPHSC|nr:hypothetical protein OCS_06589 [Ophiocordyceps sinensis CO18]